MPLLRKVVLLHGLFNVFEISCPPQTRAARLAHWGVIAGADFFTTEVRTSQGLVSYYTVFVIDVASRRVRILGSRTAQPTVARAAQL